MDINSKKVVIMMATYNGEKYIKEQIKSLQNQTFTNWELYISDDSSTDKTVSILKQYQRTDQRIKKILINQKYHGAFANYFHLMHYMKEKQKNKFDYYFYCDQDDFWIKDKIYKQVLQMEKNKTKKPIFCYSDLEICDRNLKPQNDRMSNHICTQYVKNPFNEFFKEQYVWGTSMAHDYKLWNLMPIPSEETVKNNLPHDSYVAKFAALSADLIYLNIPTVLYRRTGDNVTGTPHVYKGTMILKRLFNFKKNIDNAASTYDSSRYVLEEIKKNFKLNTRIKDLDKCFNGSILSSIAFFKKYGILRKERIFGRISTKFIFYSRIYKRSSNYHKLVKR